VVISNELTILRKHIFKLKQIVEEQETTIKKLRKELSESEQNSSNILLSERNIWVE
jgi:predicted transcriptional regulator